MGGGYTGLLYRHHREVTHPFTAAPPGTHKFPVSAILGEPPFPGPGLVPLKSLSCASQIQRPPPLLYLHHLRILMARPSWGPVGVPIQQLASHMGDMACMGDTRVLASHSSLEHFLEGERKWLDPHRRSQNQTPSLAQ
ncbi:hypothetical protein GN956_G10721 [Arapaima gigas]